MCQQLKGSLKKDSDRSWSTYFFSNLLNFNELCLLELDVALENATHTNLQAIQSEHSLKVIRCRELIFTEPDIIATPDLEDSKIEIIMQQSLFRTGRIQGRLQRMGIQYTKPRRVTPAEFQTCLNYTMVAKLAPAWNKLGMYLVQGRDFVCQEGKQNAVEYDLHIGTDEIYISLKAAIVQSSPIKLEQIGVVGPLQKEFYANYPDGRIEEYSIFNKWCHVLPSLKRGQVINVLHQLPPDGAFRTYREIKKHWKNNYGYRLPDTDDGLLYYQIYFKPIGDMLFTYPDVCVRPGNPNLYPRVDPAPILTDFLADLTSRIPTVCSRSLQFAREPHFPEAELMESSRKPESNSNLTADMPRPNFPHYRHYVEARPASRECQLSTQGHAVASASQNTVKSDCEQTLYGSEVANFGQLCMEKFIPRFGRTQSSHKAQHVVSSQKGFSQTSAPTVPRFGPANESRAVENRLCANVGIAGNTVQRKDGLLHQKRATNVCHRVADPSSISSQQEPKDPETPKAKKQRTKPQIQKDMDPEDLARNNQLVKANTATLIAWLKSKGIPCKSTEKKSELMNKVLLAVNLSRSAFD